MLNKKNGIIYKFLLIGIIIVYVICCMHPTFTLDESFTFGLIQHSFSHLISLDAMDVHPPLYYILLKIFLIITTFWTKSIIIKIIFARLFSLCNLILFCIIGNQIISLDRIKVKHVNKIGWLLIFLLMPPVIMYSLKIRMYALASTFVILTFYKLLEFDKVHSYINLLMSIFFAILSSYTFYFAGLSAGLLFIIFGIKYLYNKQVKLTFKMLLSDVILLLVFIPWLPIALHQVIYHSKNDNGNNNILAQSLGALAQSNIGGVKTIICIIVVLFLCSFVIYSFIKLSKNFNFLIIISLIDNILTLFISIILCGRNFQSGAIYSISLINMLLISIPVGYCLNNNKLLYKLLGCTFVSLLMICSIDHIYKHFNNYDKPSIILINKYNKWNNSYHKNIILRTKKFPLSKQMTASEDSVYLYSLNKNLILYSYSYNKLSSGLLNDSKNVNLVKNTFSNIKIVNK